MGCAVYADNEDIMCVHGCEYMHNTDMKTFSMWINVCVYMYIHACV